MMGLKGPPLRVIGAGVGPLGFYLTVGAHFISDAHALEYPSTLLAFCISFRKGESPDPFPVSRERVGAFFALPSYSLSVDSFGAP